MSERLAHGIAWQVESECDRTILFAARMAKLLRLSLGTHTTCKGNHHCEGDSTNQWPQSATSTRMVSQEGAATLTASIIKSDATEFLLGLSERPRLILTDPPYGMAYKSNVAGDKRWNSTGVTMAERRGLPGKFEVMQGDSNPDDIDFERFFEVAHNCLAKDSFLVLFASRKAMIRWHPLVEMAGFKVRDLVVWDKACANGGDLRWPFIETKEFLLCCSKGKPKTYRLLNAEGDLKQRIPSVLRYGRPPKSEHVGHPTQKPLFLCSQFVRAFADVGELVVDPFCGSGSSLVAAKKLGRRVAGCDLEAKYVSMTRKRLAVPNVKIIRPKCMRDGN